MKRTIRYFDLKTEEFASELPLPGNIQLHELQDLFGVETENPMYDCFVISPEKAAFFEQRMKIAFDFDSYEYTVECNA